MIDFIIEHKEFFIIFVGLFLIMMLWKAGLRDDDEGGWRPWDRSNFD